MSWLTPHRLMFCTDRVRQNIFRLRLSGKWMEYVRWRRSDGRYKVTVNCCVTILLYLWFSRLIYELQIQKKNHRRFITIRKPFEREKTLKIIKNINFIISPFPRTIISLSAYMLRPVSRRWILSVRDGIDNRFFVKKLKRSLQYYNNLQASTAK